MARYYNVTLDEMSAFLIDKGFMRIPQDKLGNCREVVFGKFFGEGKGRISMRVYTGIESNGGQSRGKGKDAIRVVLSWRDPDGMVKVVGGNRRVHRVDGWRTNLMQRIERWAEQLGPACPCCQSPMAIRKVKSGAHKGQEFMGCVMYPQCKGTRSLRQAS